MRNVSQKLNTIDRIVAKATEAANLRANDDEAGALRVEAEIAQLRSKATRVRVAYEPFAKHAELAKFKSTKALWDQVRRGAHGDRGGTNNVAALAEKFESVHTAGVAAGASTTGILFECAKLAQSVEAAHALTFRNAVAMAQNEELVRALISDASGDIEKARGLAKSRRVKWAPLYETADAEGADIKAASSGTHADVGDDTDANGAGPKPANSIDLGEFDAANA